MKQFDYIVFIGRMQPPHLAHIEIIKRALAQASKVIVMMGSANQPRTIKNPFTWQEREDMIRASLPDDLSEHVEVQPIRDKVTDSQWVAQLQSIMDRYAKQFSRVSIQGGEPKIGIIGHSKDDTSYYLTMFPQWESIEVDNIDDIHASDIRDAYFSSTNEDEFASKVGDILPTGMEDWMKAFMMTAEYERLREEFNFNVKYKRAWNWDATLNAFLDNEIHDLPKDASPQEVIRSLRENYIVAPYDNNYYCADAVVVQSGHVLLIRRRSEPGKGLWALPGGHVNTTEVSLDAAIRELKEETKLKLPIPVIRGSLDKFKPSKIFERPDRSLRGRTISHAYFFNIEGGGALPKVKGGDDADKAKWVPLSTFAEMEPFLFEDHFNVVNYFIGSD